MLGLAGASVILVSEAVRVALAMSGYRGMATAATIIEGKLRLAAGTLPFVD